MRAIIVENFFFFVFQNTQKATSTPPSSPKSKVGNSLGLSLIQDYQSPDVVNVRTSPRRSTRRVSNLGTINNDSDGLKQQTLKVQSVSIPKTPPRSPKRKVKNKKVIFIFNLLICLKQI